MSVQHKAEDYDSQQLLLYLHLNCLTDLFLQVVWDNRLANDIGNACLISVDGTDFEFKG